MAIGFRQVKARITVRIFYDSHITTKRSVSSLYPANFQADRSRPPNDTMIQIISLN